MDIFTMAADTYLVPETWVGREGRLNFESGINDRRRTPSDRLAPQAALIRRPQPVLPPSRILRRGLPPPAASMVGIDD